MKFSAVILAGGQSRRMGCDKAFLDWRGQPLLAHQIQTVRALGPEEVFISGRPGVDYGLFGCPILHDEFQDRGPLAGIAQALQAAHTPLLLVLAVDLPAMEPAYLRRLLAHCAETVGAVPQQDDHLDPLAAFYPKASHHLALDLLTWASPAVTGFAHLCAETRLVNLHPVTAGDARFFANWNTDPSHGRLRSQN